MPTPTLEEQAAQFVTESFQDGVAANGEPTAEEKAALAASEAGGAENDGENAAGGAENEGDETGHETGKEAGEAGEKDSENKGEVDGETGKKDGDAKAADGKGKGKDPAKRIGDLTANWRSAERRADSERTRADDLQRQLDELKRGNTKPLTSPSDTDKGALVAPDPASFEYGELDPKYIAALARYETGKALEESRVQEAQSRQVAAADAKRQEAAEKQDKLVRAGLQLHDDFDEVVMQGAKDGKWALSEHLGPLLLDSEFGAEISYELAKDFDESHRVAKLSPSEQAKWLGRQEAKFEAAKSSQGKTPKAPQAPPPPKTPRGNSGQFRVGADSNDFAAVERAWSAGELR